MGEFADYAEEQAFVWEDLVWEYQYGGISDQDAYAMGIIDGEGAVMDYRYGRSQSVTCRCCGKQGLAWGKQRGKWRLYDGQHLHACPVAPLPECRS